MKSLGAAKFKEQCLSLIENLDEEGLVITKHGKPIAKVVPIRQNSKDLIGSLVGLIKIHGKIESTGVKWDAES